MKPWFLVLIMGAISGSVVLRTALAEPDEGRPTQTATAGSEPAE